MRELIEYMKKKRKKKKRTIMQIFSSSFYAASTKWKINDLIGECV